MSEFVRYLVLSELFLPTKGGTAVWFDEVYRRLGGKEIHIVTADVPGAAEYDRTHPNSVHRVRLRRHRWLRPESLAIYLKLFAVMLFTGIRHRIDTVHAGRVLPEGAVAWAVARLLRRPLVIYAHGEEITSWRNPRKRAVMAFAYRRAERVIANSEFTRRALQGLGVHDGRIRVIYPGVDTARFRRGLQCLDLRRRLRLDEGQRLILSVGRLSRRKGFDRVITALPVLLDAGIDVHYALIGIGEDHDYLAALAHEQGVADRVHMLGHVASDDLPRWYNAADVFAMPNREIDGDTEGFGMVFLEAAACGKPAIAGRAGGTGDAVLDGVTGLRVDGATAAAVAAALKRCLEEPGFGAELGARAYDRATGTFDWAAVAQHTAELQRGITP